MSVVRCKICVVAGTARATNALDSPQVVMTQLVQSGALPVVLCPPPVLQKPTPVATSECRAQPNQQYRAQPNQK